MVAIEEQYPDSKVHGANMGSIWVRQDPGGPHVGPVNLAIWVCRDILEFMMRCVWISCFSASTWEIHYLDLEVKQHRYHVHGMDLKQGQS